MKKNHFTKILTAAFLMCFYSISSADALPMEGAGGKVNYQNTYAVIVAISDYQYFASGAGDLNYTDDDARKFYQYLVSPNGGGVAPQNVVLLINQAATKSAILKMLDHVFSKAKENDRVILYYSGHGQAGYLIPSDASDAHSLISYDRIKRSFKKCRAKTKMCFIDACNSNSIQLSKKQKTSSSGAREKKTDVSVVVMVSSQSYQSSVEDSNLKQGAFSFFLLKGLKGGADTNSDKTVTIEELHKYVYFHVKKYTFGKQVPHTFGHFDLDMPVAVLK